MPTAIKAAGIKKKQRLLGGVDYNVNCGRTPSDGKNSHGLLGQVS